MSSSNQQSSETFFPDLKKVLVDRQEFLKLVGLGCSGLIALAMFIPVGGFFFSYLATPRRREWISVGPVDEFATGETKSVVFEDPYSLPWDGVAARRSAWLRRVDGNLFVAFEVYCTHLGCPVRWEEGADLFMCPCHGGVYYSAGTVAAGPPPKPLHRYPVRVTNGQVEISVGPTLAEG